MGDLPASITEMVQFPPVEDLILPLLREALPDIAVYSLIPEGASDFPFLLVRRHFTGQYASGEKRGFVNTFFLRVNAFATDPDGDEKAAILAEAARVALIGSIDKEVPGVGHLNWVQHLYTRQGENWATGSGSVQYADLPAGTWRYESIFKVHSRHRP